MSFWAMVHQALGLEAPYFIMAFVTNKLLFIYCHERLEFLSLVTKHLRPQTSNSDPLILYQGLKLALSGKATDWGLA